MPLYDYQCDRCGGIFTDVWAKIDEQVMGCSCGGEQKRMMSASNISPDWQPYYDENLRPAGAPSGTWVMSRQHRKTLMKEYGLAEV